MWSLHTPLLYAPTSTPLNFDQLALAIDLIALPLQFVLDGNPAYNLAILLWFTLSGYTGCLLNRFLLWRALTDRAQTFTSAPFGVTPGENRIDPIHDGSPFGVRLAGLDIFGN